MPTTRAMARKASGSVDIGQDKESAQQLKKKPIRRVASRRTGAAAEAEATTAVKADKTMNIIAPSESTAMNDQHQSQDQRQRRRQRRQPEQAANELRKQSQTMQTEHQIPASDIKIAKSSDSRSTTTTVWQSHSPRKDVACATDSADVQHHNFDSLSIPAVRRNNNNHASVNESPNPASIVKERPADLVAAPLEGPATFTDRDNAPSRSSSLSEDEICGPKTPLKRGRAIIRQNNHGSPTRTAMSKMLDSGAVTLTSTHDHNIHPHNSPRQAHDRNSVTSLPMRNSPVRSNTLYTFHPLPRTRYTSPNVIDLDSCQWPSSTHQTPRLAIRSESSQNTKPSQRRTAGPNRVQSSPGRLRSPVVDRTPGAARIRLQQLFTADDNEDDIDNEDEDDEDDDVSSQSESDRVSDIDNADEDESNVHEYDSSSASSHFNTQSPTNRAQKRGPPISVSPYKSHLPSSPPLTPPIPSVLDNGVRPELCQDQDAVYVIPDEESRNSGLKTPHMRLALERFTAESTQSFQRREISASRASARPASCINPALLADAQKFPTITASPNKSFGTYACSPLEGGSSLIEGTPEHSLEQSLASASSIELLSLLIDTEKFVHDHDLPQTSPLKTDVQRPSTSADGIHSAESSNDDTNLCDDPQSQDMACPHYALPTVSSDAKCEANRLQREPNTPTSSNCARLARSSSRTPSSRCRLTRSAEEKPRTPSPTKGTPNRKADQLCRDADTPSVCVFTPHPGQPLRNVVALVEIFTVDGTDASRPFIASLRRLGAQTTKTWTRAVTHVVFKQGSAATLKKVHRINNEIRLSGKAKGIINCVNSRWVTDCDRLNWRVSESAPDYTVEILPASKGTRSAAGSFSSSPFALKGVDSNIVAGPKCGPDRGSCASEDWDLSPVRKSTGNAGDLSWSELSTPAPREISEDITRTVPVDKVRKLSLMDTDRGLGHRRLTTQRL